MAPFGCPAYLLEEGLQTNKPFHKWSQRATAGIYLGPLPIHAKNVALLLNTETGHVSPKYHFILDKRFDTARNITTFGFSEASANDEKSDKVRTQNRYFIG